MSVEIIIIISVFFAGLYMLGLGYKLIPDPGKKDSKENESHFNKNRKIFKFGGILAITYVSLQTVSLLLE